MKNRFTYFLVQAFFYQEEGGRCKYQIEKCQMNNLRSFNITGLNGPRFLTKYGKNLEIEVFRTKEILQF
jgi:hypothetical protein